MSSITDALCANCGLCCDGSLLADVELADGKEANEMEALGLEVEDDDCVACVMPLPCTALNGTRCSIYAHRPQTCRTFECRLLQDAEAGRVSVEAAEKAVGTVRGIVDRVNELLAGMESDDPTLTLSERVGEAMASTASETISEALSAKFAEFETLVKDQFLGDE